MKKYLKNKILEIIKEFVGDKPARSSFSFFAASYEDFFGPTLKTDYSNGTGIFRDISYLENRVKELEKFLNIEYKIEEKKFSGYKTIKSKSKK